MKPNLTIVRPQKQQFAQFPHWIGLNAQFSVQERGLLSTILCFENRLSKEALHKFCNNGERAIDTAWAGLLSKGVIVARRTKEENRYCWHYTVNLEKTESVQKQNAPLKDTVSFTAGTKIESSETSNLDLDSLVNLDFCFNNDLNGLMDFNPFVGETFDCFSKTAPDQPQKQSVVPNNVLKTPIISNLHNIYGETLLNDDALKAYLKNENYEIEPIHIVTFNHLLEVKKQIHLDYDNYKNHFRNWLPTYLAYKEKGRKLKLTSKKEDKDKCGTNKVFNILRIKIKNPQADYMTYQGWVNDLCNIDGTDLSDVDNDFKRTILAHKINGTLLNEYKTNYKPKNTK